MIALDVQYWRSWTFRGDIKILVRTPKAVLLGEGAA
jgi:lipopolysaccharide/colanic/teichoic acid biosynthesis glycosyltransferase